MLMYGDTVSFPKVALLISACSLVGIASCMA
jgi:hypothetical protein